MFLFWPGGRSTHAVCPVKTGRALHRFVPTGSVRTTLRGDTSRRGRFSRKPTESRIVEKSGTNALNQRLTYHGIVDKGSNRLEDFIFAKKGPQNNGGSNQTELLYQKAAEAWGSTTTAQHLPELKATYADGCSCNRVCEEVCRAADRNVRDLSSETLRGADLITTENKTSAVS